MTHFVRVAALADVPAGRARYVQLDGKGIALFNVGGDVYALDDSCPHAGSSLAFGKFEGAIVTCRAHGLRFDVRTGSMRGVAGLCAKTYPVEVAGGEIAVGIESHAIASPAGDAGAHTPPAASARGTGHLV